MISLDIWMRENPLTYVWFGSYAVAIEIAMVKHKRKITLQQVRLMRNAGDDDTKANIREEDSA
jgi:hypothetical protein